MFVSTNKIVISKMRERMMADLSLAGSRREFAFRPNSQFHEQRFGLAWCMTVTLRVGVSVGEQSCFYYAHSAAKWAFRRLTGPTNKGSSEIGAMLLN
jgi:hypothetical protein